MREAFDDDDLEKKDTEITLGLPSLLGIFFGLVLICGIFFGFGYTLGRGSSHSNNATNPPAATPAGSSDASPVPDSGTAKPSAQQSMPPAAAAPASTDGAAPATVTPAVASTTPGQQPGTVLATTANPAPAVKTVAAPMTAAAPQPGPAAHPATPAQVYMVQIAAVQNPADAAVLMSALRQHGYHVLARRVPQDTLTHVQIGPFESRAAANQMRERLQSDGYNAILKP